MALLRGFLRQHLPLRFVQLCELACIDQPEGNHHLAERPIRVQGVLLHRVCYLVLVDQSVVQSEAPYEVRLLSGHPPE